MIPGPGNKTPHASHGQKIKQPLKIRHYPEREMVWRRIPQLEYQLNSDVSNKYQIIPTNIRLFQQISLEQNEKRKNPDNP